MSEFNLIHEYFTRNAENADLGVGDDAALFRVSPHHQLAVSVDMSVAGTHFYANAAPYDIGWKCMAVNISDMAAMGATPKWATLAIALPDINNHWLADFSRGLFACADAFGVHLIGGDTTRGALNVSIQIMGEVPTGKALLRSGAKLDDDIWVSGYLGSAALGLAQLQGKIELPPDARQTCLTALNHPMPRVALGLALQHIAHSCIDVSDGLLADLGHILQASSLGANIDLNIIPCPPFSKSQLDNPLIRQSILAGGDDYELIFTAPATQRLAIKLLSEQLQLPLTIIGNTTANADLAVYYQGQPIEISQKGFDHFG